MGDLDLTPGSGISPGEESGNPLQYSSLENSMDRGAWVRYSPWDCKESDTTERLTLSLSAFFMVQLSHPYMATGKTMVLTNRSLLAK